MPAEDSRALALATMVRNAGIESTTLTGELGSRAIKARRRTHTWHVRRRKILHLKRTYHFQLSEAFFLFRRNAKKTSALYTYAEMIVIFFLKIKCIRIQSIS